MLCDLMSKVQAESSAAVMTKCAVIIAESESKHSYGRDRGIGEICGEEGREFHINVWFVCVQIVW